MSTTVFVSGANGFVAKQTILQLLKGGYKVIGSVRSESKGEALAKQFSNPNFKFVVVKDLEDPEAFSVLKDYPEVTKFLHLASPVNFSETDLKKITGPAVDGAVNALSGVSKYGENVTNFVLTSSVVSVFKILQPQPEYDESDWNDITEEVAANGGALGYFLSKTLAEKAAWKFVEQNKPKFKLATVLPSFVFGPQAFDEDVTSTLNESAEIINRLVTKGKLESGLDSGRFIDVRDVAKAHILAFEKDLQQRLLVSNSAFTGKDLVDILQAKYPQKSFPTVEQVEEPARYNDEKTRKALGFEYISLEKSVLDAAEQIVKVNAN